ncbi:MAG TPA: homoserine dehydrogenase, partial [Thermoanaerobaculia bacterium]|nr:homoserine dehydrogenase [Thermoanaerobaculia bacterium]
MTHHVRIGLLGCGNVGGGLVQLVADEGVRIRERYGVALEIVRVLVRDGERERPGVDRRLITTHALDVLDADCDVIVELIGGVHSAGSFVRRALARGCNVVTANKALLANCGRELFAMAERNDVTIGFEASVCGAVPVVRALRRGLAGDSIESIAGILNGTCNYVLTRMEEGLDFETALLRAQANGFAEADPSLDIDGEDAAQKLRILADLAFDAPVRRAIMMGIRGVTSAEIDDASEKGCVIRLVAEARRVAGGVEMSVAPRLVPKSDPFARAIDEENVVMIRGRASGDVTLSGRGAGPLPTASAVLSDILECGDRSR